MSEQNAELPAVIIGGGPVGLAAAAHLMEHGVEPLVLEAGDGVGAAVRAWGHIRLFSPWQYNLDPACVRLMEGIGWRAPAPTSLPTGAELIEQYLEPLARTAALYPRIRTKHRVTGISRGGRDKMHTRLRENTPFTVRVETDGSSRDILAQTVIDASGTWEHPAPLGADGLPVPGEHEASLSGNLLGPLPDVMGTARKLVARRRTLVVGAGHSAVNTLLNLAALQREEPGTEILWAIRSSDAERAYGGGSQDELPARGALGDRLRKLIGAGRIELLTSAETRRLDRWDEKVAVDFSDGRKTAVDIIVGATGFRPNLELLRELRLDVDPAVEAPRKLAPLIDPELHSCGTVRAHGAEVLAHPEEGFFIAGMKSYGRAPTFLLATGYEQVRSIAAHVAGVDATPRDLNLPETGVCIAEPMPTSASRVATETRHC